MIVLMFQVKASVVLMKADIVVRLIIYATSNYYIEIYCIVPGGVLTRVLLLVQLSHPGSYIYIYIKMIGSR